MFQTSFAAFQWGFLVYKFGKYYAICPITYIMVLNKRSYEFKREETWENFGVREAEMAQLYFNYIKNIK